MPLDLNLIPPPRKFIERPDHLNRTGRLYVQLCSDASGYLTDTILRFCELHELQVTARAPDTATLIKLGWARLPAEHYTLSVTPDCIEISGGDDAGIAYGLETLTQVLSNFGTFLPCLEIEDGPDFANRGVMLDISRCKVPTLSTLFEMIDRFAAMKLNQVQLYTEHTFAFTEHPMVWANASPLNAADVLLLKDYCAARFIELVPNLNSFGHFERWLRYPEYHRFAECPDGFEHPLTGTRMEFGSTLKPNKPSLDLLKGLYDEYLPLFDSGYFNVGGDEPWELGHGYSAKRCDELGATNVYIDFLSKIQTEVEKRGRQMMFWSDIVLKEPASLKRLSRDLIALNWGYEGNHPFRKECEAMAKQKIPFYVCPGTSSWNSLTGRIDNATRNLAEAAKHGHNHGADGYLITDWGDHGHHQYLPISYPGFLLGACNAWNVKKGKSVDLADGLAQIYFGDTATAQWLIDLGTVERLAPNPIRNATLFNRLLFWQRFKEPAVTRKVPNEALVACLDAFMELGERVDEIHPSVDAALVKSELTNALGLAEHGIHRLLEHRGEGYSASELREELMILIGQHEQLWLARNEPGGLRESVDHLNRSLSSL